MRYLVVSDLHENLDALQGTIEVAHRRGGFERIWFLGDALGHPHPDYTCDVRACLTLLQQEGAECVWGNWEGWLCHPEGDDGEHQQRWQSVLQAYRATLPPALHEYVRQWPWRLELGEFTLTHGSPFTPSESEQPWEVRIEPTSLEMVNHIFASNVLNTPSLLVGHTHTPGYFHYNGQRARWYPRATLGFEEQRMDRFGGRYLLNPGSISYNFDDVPTALLLDTEARTFRFLDVQPVRRY